MTEKKKSQSDAVALIKAAAAKQAAQQAQQQVQGTPFDFSQGKTCVSYSAKT